MKTKIFLLATFLSAISAAHGAGIGTGRVGGISVNASAVGPYAGAFGAMAANPALMIELRDSVAGSYLQGLAGGQNMASMAFVAQAMQDSRVPGPVNPEKPDPAFVAAFQVAVMIADNRMRAEKSRAQQDAIDIVLAASKDPDSVSSAQLLSAVARLAAIRDVFGHLDAGMRQAADTLIQTLERVGASGRRQETGVQEAITQTASALARMGLKVQDGDPTQFEVQAMLADLKTRGANAADPTLVQADARGGVSLGAVITGLFQGSRPSVRESVLADPPPLKGGGQANGGETAPEPIGELIVFQSVDPQDGDVVKRRLDEALARGSMQDASGREIAITPDYSQAEADAGREASDDALIARYMPDGAGLAYFFNRVMAQRRADALQPSQGSAKPAATERREPSEEELVARYATDGAGYAYFASKPGNSRIAGIGAAIAGGLMALIALLAAYPVATLIVLGLAGIVALNIASWRWLARNAPKGFFEALSQYK